MKSGRSRAGQKAAGSHTAALAGSDTAVDAVFRQAGVIRADTLGGLLDVAALLSSQPVPRGRRVAVLTNAGGLGILCADACELAGLELPQLAEETRNALAAGAALRGVDGEPRRHARLGDCRQLPRRAAEGARRPRHRRRDRAVRAARRRRCRGCRCGDQPGDRRRESARQARPGRDPRRERRARDAALRGSDPVVRLSRGGRGRPRAGGRLRRVAAPLGRHRAPARRRRHRNRGGGCRRRRSRTTQRRGSTRPPRGGCSLAYGLPLVDERLAATPEEAAAAATELGYPVVVKTARAGAHKTESGGVVLDLADAEAVRAAAERIGGPVIVQPQIQGGVELLAGVAQDPVFGPLVAFGPGGVMAELIGDAQLPADAAHGRRRGRARRVGQGGEARGGIPRCPRGRRCCAGGHPQPALPLWPTTSPSWQSSTSTRCSASPTAPSSSTRGSGSPGRPFAPTPRAGSESRTPSFLPERVQQLRDAGCRHRARVDRRRRCRSGWPARRAGRTSPGPSGGNRRARAARGLDGTIAAAWRRRRRRDRARRDRLGARARRVPRRGDRRADDVGRRRARGLGRRPRATRAPPPRRAAHRGSRTATRAARSRRSRSRSSAPATSSPSAPARSCPRTASSRAGTQSWTSPR